jgi:hypothetical protein
MPQGNFSQSAVSVILMLASGLHSNSWDIYLSQRNILINLIGTLQQEGHASLPELNVLLCETISLQTGEVHHSGLFNIAKEQSINPTACTLVFPDNRNADIVIRSSLVRGEKREIFFSVIGEFY